MTKPAPFSLPLLEPHRDALEKCVYCPKLSRAACPVSNVHPKETLTPWGKMSASYFVARGDLPVEPENAAPAWACSGCLGCRERCDHKNDVATVLFDARAELFARGAAPAAAVRHAERHEARAERSAARARELAAELAGAAPKRAGVLVGCGYHLASEKRAPGEAPLDELAVRSVAKLIGCSPASVEVVGGCCGLPLLHAGDRAGFVRAARRFMERTAEIDSIIVVDPGCARALSVFYPAIGLDRHRPTLFVDLANDHLDMLRPLDMPAPRYHDPCQLGRGLGRYDEPRRVLAKIAGAPPRELQRHGRMGECSGGGGGLPAVMPEESQLIARARIAEHRTSGGGALVTACAASLKRFRASGEPAKDLVELVAMSLGVAASGGAPPAPSDA